jgi:hypothetical protein
MESFDNFRKLWGRLEYELPQGNYRLDISNSKVNITLGYNVGEFNGSKRVVISSSLKIGIGRFFGWALIFGSASCLIAIFVIYYYNIKNKDREYDSSNIKWE